MWERFSFYGMSAFLVLFAADSARGGLGWSQASASRLMGVVRVHGLRAAGAGRLPRRSLPGDAPRDGDRRLHHRRRPLHARGAGACRRSSSGLALVAIGTGFFKVNASTMVGQLYQQGDRRRDAGFTIFYMGVNVGALLRPDRLRLPRRRARAGAGTGASARRASACCSGSASTCALRPQISGRASAMRRTALSPPPTQPAGAPLTREERDRLIALLVAVRVHDPVLDGVRAGGVVDELLRRRIAPTGRVRVRGSRVVVPVGQPGRHRPGGAAVRRAVDGAGAPRPRAQHADQDGGGDWC